ncbi:SPARC-related modular calcium-binding protein 1 isoform X2 [Chanos chanos]|uniref:SPARC-related modular calcium-binding protein 1 isoform X2 n=1 Tax=Chanos chanos TaxID=29144 RepID=A0A6J2WG97_CHACN|nr:SPARC-related modular calcium-binding protein 1 isoform X2 [Chanos chanos]
MFSIKFYLPVLLYSSALLLLCPPRLSAQKSNGQRWLIGDRESHCGILCSNTHGKPVCGSDGRSYDTSCDLQRAKCRDRTLTLAYRGRCRGKNWVRIDQPPPLLPAPTLTSEGKELELKEAGQSKCRVERSQALEQSKRPQESIFIPECNEDGTFAQVQCHTLTGYCWCVTTDGKPVSGSSVHNRTPVCSVHLLSCIRSNIFITVSCKGNFREFMGTHAGTSGLSGSVTDKPPGPPSSGRKVSFRFFLTLNPDDGSKPTPTMETHVVPEGDEITAPTLWIKQLVYKENKQNSSNSRRPEKVPSCDQERQSALDEARQNPREAIFIPDCGPLGLYKPVQCHQSTGYCWCVLVDTGRPIPGTSTRYQTPECDSDARSRAMEMEDPFRDRDLSGCPEGKKVEFITSLLDALTTDMVQAINSPAPSGGGRFVEPDPSHTLEERVVHWYFAQLDNNGSHDINKKEMKPFKRYVKKKAKPKRCARKFTDYCDLNKDKTISLQELKGCLGVNKEGGSSSSSQGTRQGTNLFIGRLV